MPRLSNKIALVTFAARGIGAAVAKAFRDEGAEVIVTDIEDERGQETADQIGARFLHLDVSDPADWLSAHKAHPRLDILVNNAGITGFETGEMVHDPANASLDAWRAVHAVNLDGTFLGCQTAIRAMRDQGPKPQSSTTHAQSRAIARSRDWRSDAMRSRQPRFSHQFGNR